MEERRKGWRKMEKEREGLWRRDKEGEERKVWRRIEKEREGWREGCRRRENDGGGWKGEIEG